MQSLIVVDRAHPVLVSVNPVLLKKFHEFERGHGAMDGIHADNPVALGLNLGRKVLLPKLLNISSAVALLRTGWC